MVEGRDGQSWDGSWGLTRSPLTRSNTRRSSHANQTTPRHHFHPKTTWRLFTATELLRRQQTRRRDAPLTHRSPTVVRRELSRWRPQTGVSSLIEAGLPRCGCRKRGSRAGARPGRARFGLGVQGCILSLALIWKESYPKHQAVQRDTVNMRSIVFQRPGSAYSPLPYPSSEEIPS
jgi:hypothetical protein